MTNRVLERRRQNAEQQCRAILEALDRQELEQRVRSLAACSLTDYDIAQVTGLHVEQVRKALSQTP